LFIKGFFIGLIFDPQLDPQECYQAEVLDKHFGGAKIKKASGKIPPHRAWRMGISVVVGLDKIFYFLSSVRAIISQP
jgi:hypothetical protein